MYIGARTRSFGKSVFVAVIISAAGLVACGESDGGESGGTGGDNQPGSGGDTSSGGTASGGADTGGTTATGGSLAAGSGGVTGTGGGATGGVTAGGGATGTGGSATGGVTVSGGATGTGGSAAGGVSGGGGASSGGTTGGMTGTGGSSGGGAGTGGVTESGGAATGGSGGTSSTGGTTAATGGGSTAGGAETGGAGTGGSTDCAGHAVSLAANGTGSDSDSAYANVEVDMQTDLPIGNTARTVEFWAFIRTTDWVGEKNEIYYYGGSANAGAFGLDFGTNPVSGSTSNHATLNPITGGGFNDDSTNDLGIDSSTDQWVHVAMVWDGTALVTYVNGLPKITTHGSGGTTALATAQSAFVLGCNPTNKACFGGYFDELRVWKVARSAAEIQANYNKPAAGNEAGLVGYWKFNEDSGTTAADAVSSEGHTAHPGTLKADSAAHLPTFIEPSQPLALVCP
jgi:hypothetical protein